MPDGSIDYGKDSWLAQWNNESEVELVIRTLCDRCLKGYTNNRRKCTRKCGSAYHICSDFARGGCRKAKIHRDGEHDAVHIPATCKFGSECSTEGCSLGHNLKEVRDARVAYVGESARVQADAVNTRCGQLKRQLKADEDGIEYKAPSSRN